MKQFWTRLSGPAKIGLVLGIVGALLTVIGLFTGDFAPLTVRTTLLGILLGGGSWGVVSWAIAAAASDAVELDQEESQSEGEPPAQDP